MPIVVLVPAFLAIWLALYIVVIRPRLSAFRHTAGIYAKIDAIEAGWWPKLGLLLKGAKVATVGFVTSLAPIVAVFYDKISGLDWTQFLPSDQAKSMATIVTMLGVVGPMLMVVLHQGAIAEAAALEPTK